MLKIRLTRIGKRNQPEFRMVLVEAKRSAASGKCIENLGYYNPRKKVKTIEKDRVQYWLSQGVQLSPSVNNMLVSEGVLKGKKIKIKIIDKKKAEEAKAAAKAAPKAPAATSAQPAAATPAPAATK